METLARGLCGDRAGRASGRVGAYVMAHLRFKQLYFAALAYAMVRRPFGLQCPVRSSWRVSALYRPYRSGSTE